MSRTTPRVSPMAAAGTGHAWSASASPKAARSPKASSPLARQPGSSRSGGQTARGALSARPGGLSQRGVTETKTAPETERTVRFEDEDDDDAPPLIPPTIPEGRKRVPGAKRKKKWFRMCRGTPPIHLDPVANDAVEMLRLTKKNLITLRFQFDNIDVDGSGDIDKSELLEQIGEPSSPFTDALFKLLDVDDDGTLSFSEFVNVCATFCMYSQEDILDFCFQIFDKDESGYLDEDEFLKLCECVASGAPMFPGNFKTALEQFDTNDDGVIDFEEFVSINRKYPLVFYPAFRIQVALQDFTLGSEYWARIMRQKAFLRMVQKHRERNNGHFPEEPFKEKLTRMCRCQPSRYTPENLAYIAGLKAAKDVKFKQSFVPPPKSRVVRKGPRPKNLVRLENFEKSQARAAASRTRSSEGRPSSRGSSSGRPSSRSRKKR